MSAGKVRLQSIEGDRVSAAPCGYVAKPVFARYLAACKRAGARYDAALRAQVADLDKLRQLVSALHAEGFGFEVPAELAEPFAAAAEAVNEPAKAIEAELGQREAGLAEGLALYPFQRQGVAWLLSRDEAGLLADEMGLGKTVQALVALPEQAPVLVIAPAAVKGVWRREAARWAPRYRVEVLAGRGSFRWPQPGEILIVNYDILAEAKRAPGQRWYTLGEAVEAACPDGLWVIADEIHMAKNPRTKRTRAVRVISRLARRSGGRFFGLTGTPLLNRPEELWHVLMACGLAIDAFGSFDTYKRMCNAYQGRWGLEWGTPTREVAELLRRVSLRRDRERVLPDLPTKTWATIEVNGLDADTRTLCDEVLGAMEAAGVDFGSDQAQAQLTQDQVLFTQLSRARKALATSKIPALLDLVAEYEEEGQPLVVFSSHRGPIEVLGEREGWAVITGSTPNERRTEIEDAFQRGELRGVAGTIRASGVGITLTRAHTAVFVDLDWTPGLNAQAEDRICRIGQDRGVIIKRLVTDHIVDQRLTELLHRKQMLIAATVEASEIDSPELLPVGNGSPVSFDVRQPVERMDCREIYRRLARAAQAIKWPRLECMYEGQRVRLQWMAEGRNPRTIVVTDGKSFYEGSRRWFGRIDKDGFYEIGRATTDVVKRLLIALNEDFSGVAGALGRGIDACCFCQKALTDEHSIRAGYGPICAARFGLPHGPNGAQEEDEG